MPHDHHQHHAHGHDHAGPDHAHGHSHTPSSFGTRFAIATALNLALVVLQLGYGIAANSVALIADAGHNFGDVLGLALAWCAHVAAAAPPTRRHTYGFRSASILAALANGVILLVATGAIVLEAIQRLLAPSAVAGTTVMLVAGIGIVVNGIAAWLLMAGETEDLNVRAAFLHLIADAAVSAGVVVAGGLILLTGWQWLDPLASLMISAVIVWSTWGLLRKSVGLSLDAVPQAIDPDAVRGYLQNLAGVVAVHDLHIWAMSTTETALTVHLVMPNGHPGDAFLRTLCDELRGRFAIGHPTVQVEVDAEGCVLAPEHVV
ncbi:MAG TPA: cation diffusion facilitator family transporter [Pseudolabrys sp.]|nr:cation diffusion facilitator family transporter [Pseudolabrys sp.]